MHPIKLPDGERTQEQIYKHYILEKHLAQALKSATREKRARLYSTLYNQLFQQIPHHPQLLKLANQDKQIAYTSYQLRLIKPFLKSNLSFLEIGAGDCHLSFEVAKYVKKIYAIDVSEEITKNFRPPKNLELIITDGVTIPLPPGSIDIAYSNQLMEHLHPGDALEQLHHIFDSLVPGGMYLCSTPHRFNGPHDISRYFDSQATGFHLKEYTNWEMYKLFKKIGFCSIRPYLRCGPKYVRSPILPIIIILEHILGCIPQRYRHIISSMRPLINIFGIRLIAIKPKILSTHHVS